NRVPRPAITVTGARHGAEARRVPAPLLRRAPVPEPSGPGPQPAAAQSAAAAPHDPGPARQPVRLPLRGLQPAGLRPVAAHQGAGGGVDLPAEPGPADP